MQTLEQTLKLFQELVIKKPEGQALEVVNPKPSFTAKLPNESSLIEEIERKTISNCLDSQDQLTRLLQQTYALLKKYGEAADVAEMRDAGFQFMLGDYTIEQITSAFRQYLKTNREIPTPADIIEIIDPSTKPLSTAFYLSLREKAQDGKYIMPDERKYMNRFENEELRKVEK